MSIHRKNLYCRFFLLFFFISPASANDKIAVIIDDLGFHYPNGLRTLQLSGKVASSFLPYTPYAIKLAHKAHQLNKEILLHLPMEALGKKSQEPGILTSTQPFHKFYQTLYGDLFNIPHISGINNHKGSLLTGNRVRMQWLMRELSQLGNIFFIDSYTHFSSVVYQTAKDYGIKTARRDTFLDNVRTHEAIQKQWQKLIDRAKINGSALAIGHPYKQTLDILEKNLPLLKQQNIDLITVKQLIQFQQNRQ